MLVVEKGGMGEWARMRIEEVETSKHMDALLGVNDSAQGPPAYWEIILRLRRQILMDGGSI